MFLFDLFDKDPLIQHPIQHSKYVLENTNRVQHFNGFMKTHIIESKRCIPVLFLHCWKDVCRNTQMQTFIMYTFSMLSLFLVRQEEIAT